MRYSLLPLVLIIPVALTAVAGSPADRGPRNQPGTVMGLYAPEQHELYDGRFVIRGTRIYQAGVLNDPSPWDHMDNEAARLRAVEGVIDIDVNEISNTGSFRAELKLPEGLYIVVLEPGAGEAGAVNPAAQQLDFYIRSPARNPKNHPDREVFDHFFAMDVTWR